MSESICVWTMQSIKGWLTLLNETRYSHCFLLLNSSLNMWQLNRDITRGRRHNETALCNSVETSIDAYDVQSFAVSDTSENHISTHIHVFFF